MIKTHEENVGVRLRHPPDLITFRVDLVVVYAVVPGTAVLITISQSLITTLVCTSTCGRTTC